MATEKERRALEYVKLVGYEDTISHLGDVSGNIGNCMTNVSEVNNLEKQKHDEIRKAKSIVRDVLKLAKQLDYYLLKKKFSRLLHRRAKSLVYVQGPVSDRTAVDMGKENLRNLKTNLEKMESHFEEM